ncbi:MAG: AMP-binding protein [Planctomycetes bacterium]|nr:AMP-binding protein [Planctomycetota bacterium]
MNVAAFLDARADETPDAFGLGVERDGAIARNTWRELRDRARRFARVLADRGVRRGDRALVLAPPSRDWWCTIHGLWYLGAAPVLIDPGMPRASFLAACKRIAPRVFVGSSKAQLARYVHRSSFRTVELSFGLEAFAGIDVARHAERATPFDDRADLRDDELAAVLFTSGATGPAKGAEYTHPNFAAQVAALRELYGIRPGDVDLACFPLFALFAAALGIESVLPELDFTRPAACDPARIARALELTGATQSFGSPAIWSRVVAWAEEAHVRFPKLARLMIAGAPVPPRLVLRAKQLLPHGEVHTPYGATEALPVSNASGADLERLRAKAEGGSGAYLGKVAPEIELALIRITDEPLLTWSDALRVKPGEPGEICVRGPVVTRAYAFEAEATARAKIYERDHVWHRMGDLGRLDDAGELWLLGRKSHRVTTPKGLVFPVPIESVFDLHEYVDQSALVGVGEPGAQRPILVVVPKRERFPSDRRLQHKLAMDIQRTGMWFPCCNVVEAVLFKDSLPVDPRHNAKIDRTALAAWAERELR